MTTQLADIGVQVILGDMIVVVGVTLLLLLLEIALAVYIIRDIIRRQDMPFQDSVTAGRTMISDNGVVYFLGRNGVYSFDGMSVPKQISEKIEP